METNLTGEAEIKITKPITSDISAEEFAAGKVKETIEGMKGEDTAVTPADTAEPIKKESKRRAHNWWRSLH